jgi:membrane protease subunit (stomatin/prohibitin family)
MTDIFANSTLSYLDMTANMAALSAKVLDQIKPSFFTLGLELTQFAVENISLPDELQKSLDQRIGMNMVGDPRQVLAVRRRPGHDHRRGPIPAASPALA